MISLSETIGEDDMVDFLLRCKIDFKFFCERVLGDVLEFNKFGGLQPYQLEWFYNIQNFNRVVIRAPSGFGKTTIMAVAYPIWLAFTKRNKQIMIVSKTIDQARRILEIIRHTIEEVELLHEIKPKNIHEAWSKQIINTSTQCRIFVRPYSINVKGERVDFMILDEAASYENTDIYFDYIVPRLNPKGKIAMISTPESTSDLMSLIEAKGLDYFVKDYKAIVNMKRKGDYASGQSIWAARFPVESLMKIHDEQGDQFFEKNFMCNTKAESEDSIFSLKSIMQGFDYARKFDTKIGGQCFLACDFAISRGPKADFDAFVVLDKHDNYFIIKHIEIHKGMRIPVKVTRINELIEIYNPSKVVVDESNLGQGVIDEMKGRGISLRPQKFSPAERKNLLVTLKNVIDDGRLILPRNKDYPETIKMTDLLVEQLLGFREEKSEKTGHKLITSHASHDDVAISTAMAVKEAVRLRDTGFWG